MLKHTAAWLCKFHFRVHYLQYVLNIRKKRHLLSMIIKIDTNF